MTAMRRHSDQVRAAVMAALLTGQSVTEAAKNHGIDRTVVGRWKQQLHSSPLKKSETIEALLLDYVRQNLMALQAQVEVAGRPEYILKQSASELAVLHGVMADKMIRILAAFEPIESERKTSFTTEGV